MTTKEFNPFLFYSAQLQKLLDEAAEQKNPALWLYTNDARTPLFMLEALTRLHNKTFKEKLFAKWNKRFKKLEDLFGEIDEYIVLEKELKTNKKITKEVIKYFEVNSTNYITKCNQRLNEKDWLNGKLQSFDDKLRKYTVNYNKEYLDELTFSLVDEIDEILDFCLKYNYEFTKIEEQIHELRRKLRWLSIYAQALQGLIQLKKTPRKSKKQINYFTKEIVSSRYNKLPVRHKNVAIIQFDQDSFFALSWLIKELGRLKDTGLKIEQLSHAIYITEELTETEAHTKAISILGHKKTIQKDILVEASAVLKIALSEDKILDKLIIS
jgi:hypothetical protein